MRTAMIAFVGAMGLALSASAAPAVPNTSAQHNANIVAVAGGCGPGLRPTTSGRCAPFHHMYRGGRFYGSGDFSADDLNRQELNRLNRY
jgi:hypothetical protein